jgi:hypothetical protein
MLRFKLLVAALDGDLTNANETCLELGCNFTVMQEDTNGLISVSFSCIL